MKKQNSTNKKKHNIEQDHMAETISVDTAGNRPTQSKSAISKNFNSGALQDAYEKLYEKYRSYWYPQFAAVGGTKSIMYPAFLLCRTLEREFLMFFLHFCFK